MIVDSSALVAILRQEPDAQQFSDVLHSAPAAAISAATVVEISVVAGPTRHGDLDDLLTEAHMQVVAFDREHALAAREAYARFGKGSGSQARLNFGDCLSYALAKVTGRPLLFKGDDFTHTDVTAAYLPR
ncbi:MAG TPA: type II toxin-antitoxin system VapC family toxin [Nocardioidaceae bacterium]|nr:type II toxin-antitoxin system VapC family toxin [Nocardioidaceae bacterium]